MYFNNFRFNLQHRAFYCYVLLSLWICVLLGVMYKYVGIEATASSLLKHQTTEINIIQEQKLVGTLIKAKKITKFCNIYKDIRPGSEGNFNSNYSLEGVIVLIRHGDRGPLTHVVNVTNINCDGPYDPLYGAFESYIKNITGTPALSQLLGVFRRIHSPLPAGGCDIGLLTKIGASQLLATGRVLREVYKHSLNISSSRIKDEIKVFSTSYSRTVHSALAFLYAFLDEEDYPKIVFQSVSSLTFCFDDCACPKANYYLDQFVMESSKHLRSHPAVFNLVKAASSIVYEIPHKKLSTDPHSLKDALLTYICHNSKLPCKYSFASDRCVKPEQVTGLFTYLNWETKQSSKSKNFKRGSLLRAYGLLKNIVAQFLQMISERKPKLILYSGHDKTLSFLTSALGITSDGVFSPYYASRLIFEIYKSKELKGGTVGPIGSDYFFRLLFNGKDITTKVHFCKGVANHHPARQQNVTGFRNSSFFLCPLESIVRFLHDDYFSAFNATNLKDACAL
ncbi:2-phosphoxylose phosphatase 1 [Halyomorpha halys]|uniref:2-phosphoxylose phosphatase 1 n=1 Tax=Halyomorpha halys TaxID=286706 RepID=UPI0006D4CF65|nr:2-phosphoxylose phosphatase 1 [Halyomorpha halys]